MYKGIRRFAAAALAVAMIAASPLTALADENDAATGPAFDADLLSKVGETVPSADNGVAQAGVAPGDTQTDGGQNSEPVQEGSQASDGTARKSLLPGRMRPRRQQRRLRRRKRLPARQQSLPIRPISRSRC